MDGCKQRDCLKSVENLNLLKMSRKSCGENGFSEERVLEIVRRSLSKPSLSRLSRVVIGVNRCSTVVISRVLVTLFTKDENERFTSIVTVMNRRLPSISTVRIRISNFVLIFRILCIEHHVLQ